MKTLLTGFGAFPGVPINPTDLLISGWRLHPERRPSHECECHTLPTEYAASEQAICQLLTRQDPRLLIMTGVKECAPSISLERFALNIDDCVIADATGEVREAREIRLGGPGALTTTVDLGGLRNVMVAREYNIEISNHAGTYVCNHAYYTALDLVQSQRRDTDVVFVHFPMHPLLARRDIFENGSLQYFEVALREIWQYLKRRRHKDRNAV